MTRLSDRHLHAEAESAAEDDAQREAPTLYREIDACSTVILGVGGPGQYRPLSEAEIRELLDALESAKRGNLDAERYAYAKTLEGQVVVMETLKNLGAAALDQALDDAMAEDVHSASA